MWPLTVGAAVEAGVMVLPMLASLPLRLVLGMAGSSLVEDGRVFFIIVADLDRLLWTKLPSKEDKSTIGALLSSKFSALESGALLCDDVGESLKGFSTGSVEVGVVTMR